MFKNYGIRAIADIRGGPLAPDIRGVVIFSDVPGGTEVYVEVEDFHSISLRRRMDSQSGLMVSHS